MAFNLWKQLKKRIRRRGRRPLWTLGGLGLWLTAALAAIALAFGPADVPSAEATGSDIAVGQPSLGIMLEKLRYSDETAEVMLHRIYVCGEETEPLGRLSADNITSLLREHADWSAMMETDGRTVRVEQRINDLSRHCKIHAYFGIDRDGNFSLYDGEPKQEKVMRTFFQLNIHYLESSLPQEEIDHLSRGIRVSDIDEYNSVLSTFSDYALEDGDREEAESY